MYPRRFWLFLGLPGLLWLTLFVGLAFYAVIAIATGGVNQILFTPVPSWAPWSWQFGALGHVLGELAPGGVFWPVLLRTFIYIASAVAGCVLIGYPVAYYIARQARRTKALLLVLILAPFLVSYMIRMLAWIGLLLPDGYVNRILIDLHLLSHARTWLNGQPTSVIIALIYGYVPYFILPVYASVDRIDGRLLEAAQDLGASRATTFRRITLPLSYQGLLGGVVMITLPMFGDFYTNDLISGSPRTAMLGNQIDLFVQGGVQITFGAALVVVLFAVLMVLMSYYVYTTARAIESLA